LKANQEIEIVSYEGEILGINLPAKVDLTITHCEPAVRGDTVNKAMKDATLETGWKIRVPLFINEGDSVQVSTDNGDYDGRSTGI
jgi:elongation factor P